MERYLEVPIVFGIILVSCLIAWQMGFAEPLLGTPKANMEVSNLVPFALVQKIALKKAEQKWGHVAQGPVLPACDDDGDIVAYIFPFAIGVKTFPAYEDILSSVKGWRKVAEKGLEAMTETERLKVLDDVANDAGVRADGSQRLGPTQSLQARANEKAKRLGREKMIGAGQYGTIVVSARYDRFPVPLYMHYLPPNIYQGDLAAEKAATALSAESVALERIYFLERMRAMYTEYSANGQEVLIQSFHLGAEPQEKVLTGKGMKGTPEPEAMSRLAEEWEKITKEVE
jgi:hypothetical protein